MSDDLAARYYLDLAAAYVRGLHPGWTGLDAHELFRRGLAAGVRLHRFKRNAGLPRVRRVLGLLRGLAPAELLDVGSGRGAFVWPLLDEMPSLPVTAIDLDVRRVEQLRAVAHGGCERLRAEHRDVCALDFPDGSFDGVTVLEVLEHLPQPARAVAETVRVARRFVVVSVPSHEDDNPGHLHLLDRPTLEAMFTLAGARSVRVEQVPGHLVVLALR